MILRIADKLTESMFRNDIISDDKEIYKFGIALCLSSGISFATVLLISLLTNHLFYAMIYLFIFTRLRTIMGGYHCKTYFTCNVAYISIYLIFEFLIGLEWEFQNIFLMELFSSVLIWCYAPSEHKNKPLSNDEYRQFRLKSRIMVIMMVIGSFLISKINLLICFEFVYILSVNAILVLIGERRRSI